jgi:hypothetical protein
VECLIKIRLLGTDRPEGWSHPRIVFDPAFSQEECAGVLCWGAFDTELATYRGLKAWYYPEPRHLEEKTSFRLCTAIYRASRILAFL